VPFWGGSPDPDRSARHIVEPALKGADTQIDEVVNGATIDVLAVFHPVSATVLGGGRRKVATKDRRGVVTDVATMLRWYESRLHGDDELAAGRLTGASAVAAGR
jgi:hypothetical protein